jgi:hypothetical protein
MRIAVYSLCYNEEFMLPYFLRHYRFASSITIFDNKSTDSSTQIMKRSGVTIKQFNTNDEVRDDIMLYVKNNFWKSSRRRDDWVIVVDIDEFVVHPNLEWLLSHTSATILRPFGYCMLCKEMPTPEISLTTTVRTGVPDPQYSKPCIFRPDCIAEMNFKVGAHNADPQGLVLVEEMPELKLLHYNYLTLDYHLARCKQRSKRLSKLNVVNGWGKEYLLSTQELTNRYRMLEAEAKVVV